MDDAPGINWVPRQQNLSRAQRNYIYEAALALMSETAMATAMGTDRSTLHRMFEIEKDVQDRYNRIKMLVLQTMAQQVVGQALHGNTQLLLRVLASNGIFRETQHIEQTTRSVNYNANAVVDKESTMEELQDAYHEILAEDAE